MLERERLIRYVYVRLTENEKRDLERLVTAKGYDSVSAFVRDLIKDRVKRG